MGDSDLKKSLYGMKQSPKGWFHLSHHLESVLRKMLKRKQLHLGGLAEDYDFANVTRLKENLLFIFYIRIWASYDTFW